MKTRQPTGEVGYPSLIIEGRESTWKTSTCLRFTADARVGAAYVVEVGERRADEYAALGNFQIVEHNGSLRQVVEGIRGVMAEPPKDDRPNVLMVDSGTMVWDLVKREAERIAKSSAASRRKLEEDPNAEIEIGHQAWNKAKDRYWWPWLNELRAWPGIALITCRADEVSKFVDGRPVANQTDYRVEVEKGTLYIVDGVVRMRGANAPLLVSAKSSPTGDGFRFSVPDGGLELPADDPLGHLIFDLFGAGTTVALTLAQAKSAVVAGARSLGWVDQEAVETAAAVWKANVGPDTTVFGGALMRTMLDALPRKVETPPAAQPTPEPSTPAAPDDPAGETAEGAPPSADGMADACQLCGSKRANLTLVDGVTRCMVVSGCEERQAKNASDPGSGADSPSDGEPPAEGTTPAPDRETATQDPDEQRGLAEVEACAHVAGLSKVTMVAELASHGIAADVRADDLPDQLIAALVAVAMGEPVPGATVDTTTTSEAVAEQQALA